MRKIRWILLILMVASCDGACDGCFSTPDISCELGTELLDGDPCGGFINFDYCPESLECCVTSMSEISICAEPDSCAESCRQDSDCPVYLACESGLCVDGIRGDGDLDGDIDGDGDADAGVECDPVANTGCEPDERCAMYRAAGETMEWSCMPTMEDAPGPGETCFLMGFSNHGTFDNCQGGSWCALGSVADGFRCMRLCSETDASSCTSAYPGEEGGHVDGVCGVISVELFGTGILGCHEPSSCDPLCDQPCGDMEEACLPITDDAGNFATACVKIFRDETLQGEGYAGDPCDDLNGCQPGFICMSDDRCHALCNVELEPPPPYDRDPDGDGLTDATGDNCPYTPNIDQTDTDGDGAGDACDGDYDADSVLNRHDNCPDVPNPRQHDDDDDGVGDACEEELCELAMCGVHWWEHGGVACVEAVDIDGNPTEWSEHGLGLCELASEP